LFYIKLKIDFPKSLLKKLGEELTQNDVFAKLMQANIMVLWPSMSKKKI